MPLQDHMQLISTDDHLIEHPKLWTDRLPARFLEAAVRHGFGEPRRSTMNSKPKATAAAPDNGVAPADAIDTSGAPQQIVPDVDMNHPAVDNDPRAGTTVEQNRIDFNDPGIEGHEAVEKNLAKQS